MLPYYILILTPCLSLFISKDKQRTKKVLGVFFFILTILVAFRNIEIGNDTHGYYAIFTRYSSMSINEIISSAREPAFGILTKII